MATALGFGGVGNKNQGFSGSTGGGAIQPLQMKMQPNGQLGLSTDGSGGFLNYLKGAAPQAANAIGSGVSTAANAVGSGIGSAAGSVGSLLGGL